VRGTILDLGPAELAIVQTLGHKTNTRAAPGDKIDAIHPLDAEDVDSPREWICHHRLAHEYGKAFGSFAEVDGLGCHEAADGAVSSTIAGS
jgi:hypothetical protein